MTYAIEAARADRARWMVLSALLALAAACTDLDTGMNANADAAITGSGGSAGSGGTANTGGTGGSRSGGSGGAGGSGGTAGSDGGAPDASDADCSPDGALRCAAAGSTAREQCVDGVWTQGEPCDDGELCDGSSTAEPGRCASAAEFCQGSADKKVCVDDVMHECNADSISVGQEACASERHCQAGLEAGACASCVPEETYRCTGAALEICNEDGTDFVLKETCASAALCNEEARACTADACTEGSHSCTDADVLQVCNDDRTAFEDEAPCAAGLCDETDGQCDVCTPGEKTCVSGAPTTCNAEGQGVDTGTCAAPRSICTGQGVCVQCTADGECTAAPPRCRRNVCNVGTGDCGTAVTAGATCTTDAGGAGTCTDAGACVECRGSADCRTTAAPHCNTTTNRCVACTEPDHCSTALQCRQAYCTTDNRCATSITEGDACNGGNVCDAAGACVQCTSNAHCDSPGRTRCDTEANECVQCTSDSHCTTTGLRRCDTEDTHECVQCTTAAHCGSTVDWACNGNVCERKARCGNGIIEPQNNEQCDDPLRTGQNTCTSGCRIAGYYGTCSLPSSGPPLCPSPFDDSQCGAIVADSSRICLPGCSATPDCPNLAGWAEVCVFTSCMLDCTSDGECPLGQSCVRAELGGRTFNLCVP